MDVNSFKWGNHHDHCVPWQQRNPIKKDWTCDQYLDFDDKEASFQLIGVITNGYELGLYSILFVILFYQRYGGTKGSQMSLFPIFIVICVIMYSIFCLLRINAMFPFTSITAKSHFDLMVYYNCINIFFIMSAFWLFALKYYETAVEIDYIINEDVKQLEKT